MPRLRAATGTRSVRGSVLGTHAVGRRSVGTRARWLGQSRQSLGCAKCRDTAVCSLSKFYSAKAWWFPCHRLARWSVTLAATQGILLSLSSYTHCPAAAEGGGRAMGRER